MAAILDFSYFWSAIVEAIIWCLYSDLKRNRPSIQMPSHDKRDLTHAIRYFFYFCGLLYVYKECRSQYLMTSTNRSRDPEQNVLCTFECSPASHPATVLIAATWENIPSGMCLLPDQKVCLLKLRRINPGQEANNSNLRIFFIFYTIIVC